MATAASTLRVRASRGSPLAVVAMLESAGFDVTDSFGQAKGPAGEFPTINGYFRAVRPAADAEHQQPQGEQYLRDRAGGVPFVVGRPRRTAPRSRASGMSWRRSSGPTRC